MASRFTTRDLKPWGRPAPPAVRRDPGLESALRDPDRNLRPWAWYVLGRAVAELPSELWEAKQACIVNAVLPYGSCPDDLYEVRAAVRLLRREKDLDGTQAAIIELTLDRLDGWSAEFAGRQARYGYGALMPTDFSECTAFQDFRDRVGAAAGRRDPHYAFGHAVGRWLAGVDADGRTFLPGRWDRPRPPGCGRLWGFEGVVAAYRDLPAGSLSVPEFDRLVRPGTIKEVTEADAADAFDARLMGWEHMDDSAGTAYVQTQSLEDAVRELADEMPVQLLRCRRAAVALEPSGPPVWDPAAATLTYAGLPRPVATQGVRVREVLDAFQEACWPDEVVVFAEIDAVNRRVVVNNTVAELNRMFGAMRFNSGGSGRILWRPRGSAA